MKPHIFCLVLTSSLAASAGDAPVLSLSSNGQLAWTNTFPNGLYTVEWAPQATGGWANTWSGLRSFAVTSQTSVVSVPMLYRVKCATNLFWPLPLGGSFVFRGSNAVGQVWTRQSVVSGYFQSPALGVEEALIETTEPGRLYYSVLRSTDTAAFTPDTVMAKDNLSWSNAPVGTTWTNDNFFGTGYICTVTVETNETVTVPAGSFQCLRFHTWTSQPWGSPPEWIEWIQPGFGLVKMVDYTRANPPVVYELQSWSPGGH